MKKLLTTLAMLVALFAIMSISASALVTTNVAAGKTVTTTYHPWESEPGKVPRPVEKIVDGNHSQESSTMTILDYDDEGDITVDLGDVYDISGYGIYNYKYPAQYSINTGWKVSVSTDGTNYTEVSDAKLPEDPASIGTGGYDLDNLGDKTYFKETVQGRYVKLKITGVYVGGINDTRNAIQIYEFEVYGSKAEAKQEETAPAVTETKQEETKPAETKTETKTETKKEETKPAETKTETKTEEKKEETKTETKAEEKKEETAPATTATETKPAETKKEETKKETKTETKQEEKKEETKTDDTAAPADDTAAPAEESSSNTGLIIGIIAAVVVLAVVLALVLKKKKN